MKVRNILNFLLIGSKIWFCLLIKLYLLLFRKLRTYQVIISPSFGREAGQELRIVVSVLKPFLVNFTLEILIHCLNHHSTLLVLNWAGDKTLSGVNISHLLTFFNFHFLSSPARDNLNKNTILPFLAQEDINHKKSDF